MSSEEEYPESGATLGKRGKMFVTDSMVRAALLGWNNVPDDHVLSQYQNHPETIAAWKRAIERAILAAPEALLLDEVLGRGTDFYLL